MDFKDSDSLEESSAESVVVNPDTAPATLQADQASNGGGKHFSLFRYNRSALRLSAFAALLIMLIGGASLLLSSHSDKKNALPVSVDSNFNVGNLSDSTLPGDQTLQLGQASQLDINGELKVANTVVLVPGNAPTNPTSGQIYYDQKTNQPYYYNGVQFISLSPSSITRVNSLQGQTGDVTLTAGSGISISGTTISSSGLLGSGTAGQIGLFTGSRTLSGSILSQSGSLLTDSGDLSVTGTVTASALVSNSLQQTGAGNDVNISAGNDNITFTDGGRTFIFPSGGGLTQDICTTSVSCASGAGTAVILQPGTAQADSGSGSSVFINNTGGGSLLRLQSNGTDRFVVNNTGGVTANSFSGDGTNVTNVNAAQLGGQLPTYYLNASNINSGTLADTRLSPNVVLANGNNSFSGVNSFTNSGNSFTGDGSSLTNLNASVITNGTLSDARLNPDVTLAGNQFNGANQLVQLTNTGVLPTLSGINLTNLNATNLASGTLANARLSTNVTLQGNSFNGASQLVQLDVSGALPAISGAALTNLNGTAISSGAVAVAFGGTGAATAAGARINLVAAQSGANSDITSLLDLTAITPSSALTIGAAGQNLALQGASTTLADNSGGFTSTLGFTAPTANNTIVVPNASGTICLTTGNCEGVGGPGANNSLSNLASVALNVNLLPGMAGSVNLGSSSLPFGALSLSDGGSNSYTISGAGTTGNKSVIIPTFAGGSATLCLTTGNCAGSGSGITGSGSVNTVALFSGTQQIGNSLITQDGGATTVTIGGQLTATGTITGDGSGLTNLNGSNISSGTVANARLTTNVTLQGNAFNGASELVQLTAGGVLPVLSGVNLTNLNATNLTSGTVADNRLSANVALLAQNGQVFSGTNIFQPTSGNDSVTFFRVQNAAGSTTLLDADTTDGRVGIGTASPAYPLDVVGQVNSSTGYSINGVPICSSGGCTAATGSNSYIQNGTLSQTANFNIQSTSASAVTATIQGATGQSADILDVKTSGGNVFKVSNTGAVTSENSSNSTTAFQIQSAGGSSTLLDADTTNLAVGIAGASTSAGYALNVTGTGNFSTNLYVNGVAVCTVATCAGGSGGTAFVQGGNSFGVTAVLGTNDSNSLSLEANGATQVTIAVGGATTFKNSTNSTSAFQIQNAGGTSNLFVADTTDSVVGIGVVPSSSGALLQVGGSISATTAFQATGSASQLQFTNGTASGGNISKAAFFNGSASPFDVVVLTGVNGSNQQVATTTTARDTKVYGIAQAATSNAVGQVVTSGNYQVNVGSGAVAIGDQLVTSSVAGQAITDNTATTGIIGTALSSKSAGSAGTVWISIRPVGGVSTPDFTPTSNSTTAFQIQNAARNSTLLDADTSNLAIGIAGASTTAGYALNVTGTGNFSTNLYVNGTAVCTITTCALGSGGTAFVQGGNSFGATAVLGTNDSNPLTFETNGVTQATIAVGGATTFKNSTNSATAFQIQPSGSSTPVLDVDTTNSRVGIGTAAPGYLLDVESNTNNQSNVFIKNTSSGTSASSALAIYADGGLNGGVLIENSSTNATLGGAGSFNIVNSSGPLTFATGASPVVQATINSTGQTLFKNSANSGTAFQIQNSTGGQVLDVDDTNNTLTLDAANSSATLGANLITNSTFATGTGWSGTNWSIGSGSATHTTGAGHTQALTNTAFTPTTNTGYELVFTFSGASGNGVDSITPSLGGATGQTIYAASDTSETQVLFASSTASLAFTPTANWAGSITSVTLFKITSDNSVLNVFNSSSVNDLQIRTAGSANNTLIGVSSGINMVSGTANDTVLGYLSLASDVSGGDDTALGSFALENNSTGNFNTAVGNQALQDNTTGASNTAVGNQALQDNTTGTTNTAVGASALQDNTTGGANVAIGQQVLANNTIGSNNVAIGGLWTLLDNTTGSNNTALGYLALLSNTTGGNNVALGYEAGFTATGGNANTTGSGNTFLGYQAGPGVATQLQNATAIGNAAVVSQSNSLVLGCINGTNGCTAATSVGIGTATPGANLNVIGTDIFEAASNAATTLQVQNSTAAAAIIVSTNNVTGGYNAANSILDVAKDSGTGRSINAAGTINASGADYAEWIPWSGAQPAQGSIVSYQGSDFVVSSPFTAGFIGNDKNSDNSILVTFAGQVPVLVTGSVNAGDILVDNGDGTAKAVNPSTATVGELLSKIAIAQQSSSDTGVKTIQASVGTTSSGVAGALQNETGNFADLNVSGTATVNNLTVTGLANVGDLEISGHIITSGGQPVATAQTGAGSGASVSVSGDDTTGTITITTGNAPSAGDLAQIAFSKLYAAAPHIVLSPSNDTASAMRYYKGATSASGFMLDAHDMPAPNTTYVYDYFIAQ